MKTLPMLCQNCEVYRGPHIPTFGLKGHVHAEGLLETDVVEIVGVRRDKSADILGEIRHMVEAVIFDPNRYQYVRAVRVQSSGSPIDVWVG